MSENDLTSTLLAAATKILRPLIKVLLRYGISYAVFTELSKRVYFDVAKNDFAIPGKKQTSSRISTMTGLSRKEVARLESLSGNKESLDTSRINRAARVISGWIRDAEFLDGEGEPADLAFEGESNSFMALVKRYSGDITARTIADELIRVGAITQTHTGLIHLNTRAYASNLSEVDKITILGTDVSDLISTIDHNLEVTDQPYLQRKVSYNYIPAEKLPEIKKKIESIAQKSLESMDKILAENAVGKKAAKKTVAYTRTGIGIYYFEGRQS
jgi:hypothetical protein